MRSQRYALYYNIKGAAKNLRQRHIFNLLITHLKVHRALPISQLVQYSTFVPLTSSITTLIQRGYIFLNGKICLNNYSPINSSLCLQFTVSNNFLLWMYIKLLYKYLTYFRRTGKYNNYFIKHNFLVINTTMFDVPLCFEIDYTTLTCFYLYKICNNYTLS